MRVIAVLLAMLVTAPAARAGTPPDDPPLACPGPHADYEGRPPDLPRGGIQAPVRSDPDGFTTLTLGVEDPQDDPASYSYTDLGGGNGVFAHRWPTEREMVTYGAFRTEGATKLRIPLLLTEGPGVSLVNRELDPFGNTLWLAVQALLAEEVTHDYPNTLQDYRDYEPFYVWTTYRTTPAGELWAGLVRTHDGNSRELDKGDRKVIEGCRRTQVGLVTRTDDATSFAGGIYLFDEVRGDRTADRQDAVQKITVGGQAAGTDVPVTTVRVDEEAHGEPGTYATYQRDDITIGVTLEDEHRPLIGLRSEVTHAEPPEAQNRLLSLGVYGRTLDFHPQLGMRTHFENRRPDEWIAEFLSAGPGSQDVGDWEADLGLFDPYGEFVPSLGAAYDDSLDQAGRAVPTGIAGVHPSQALVTAGAWAAGEYHPAIGTTYDGQVPLLHWLAANETDRFDEMGPWLTSVGAFGDGYTPVAGASYSPGEPGVEEYRVGAFAGPYPQFVPLAGADWSSERTSLWWAQEYQRAGRVPARARVDAGPVSPVGGFTPVLGVTAEGGGPDRYGLGVWAAGGFVPLLEVCYVPVGQDGEGWAGVAASGGPERTPLVWAGRRDGAPDGGASEDCPEG